MPYAYHDPCHAPRIHRDGSAPRRLLGHALGREGARDLFWRGERAQPCGAVGGLELTHPDIASALAASRLADAAAAGARRLVTDDVACWDQLSGHGANPDVLSLYDVLAERAAT
jgi:Fe-S oxidoreductase